MSNHFSPRAKQIHALLRENPAVSNTALLADVPGATISTIRHIRQTEGYPASVALPRFDYANQQWLLEESKRLGVGPNVIINSLLTDARLDEEERAND